MSMYREVLDEQDLILGEEYRVEVVDIHKIKIFTSTALDEDNGFHGTYLGIDEDDDCLFEIPNVGQQCFPSDSTKWPEHNVQVLEKVGI